MLKKMSAVGLLFITAAAQAADGPAFYAGASVGRATLKTGDSGVDGHDTAYKLFGGVQVNRNLGFELAYIDAGKVEDSPLGIDVSADISGYMVSAIGRLPAGKGFSLFAKGGALLWKSEVASVSTFGVPGILIGIRRTESNEGAAFAYGFGGAWEGARVLIRLEYETANDLDGVDLGMFSLGAAWRF